MLFPVVRFALFTPNTSFWIMFPFQATYYCHSLPHASGFPTLRVLWNDPTPYKSSVVLSLRLDKLTSNTGTYRVSQVPDTSLYSCHVLGPRQILRNLAIYDSFVLTSMQRTMSSSVLTGFTRLNMLQDVRSSLWPK